LLPYYFIPKLQDAPSPAHATRAILWKHVSSVANTINIHEIKLEKKVIFLCFVDVGIDQAFVSFKNRLYLFL